MAQCHTIPLSRITHNICPRPFAAPADQNARSTFSLRTRQKSRAAQLIIFPIKRHRFIALQQTSHNFHAFVKPVEAWFDIEQIETKEMMFAFLPARTQTES